MTLARALGHISETPPEDQYRVKLVDRLRELMFHDPETFELGPDFTFEYRWSGGYEELTIKNSPRAGGSHYGGSYHPNGGYCEGEGICKWCGRTLLDW